ncbi:MAG: GntR family transcriptional regulator [Dehalococcoidia bacterium]|jgi:GntR family transcriptional regulator
MLTREKGVPLYYQLDTILRKKILSGEIAAGAPFPTEDLLVQQYNISRITVRQALASLEKDRLIVRKQGKGTFVAEKIERAELPKLSGTGNDLVDISSHDSKRIKIMTRVVGFSRLLANKTITDYLGIPEGEEIIRIERVRLANEKPLYHLLNYLPLDIGEKLNQKALKNKTLTHLMETDLKIVIKKAVQTIEADTVDSYIGAILEAREGDPCLILRRVVYEKSGRAIEYLVATFRADRYMYTNMLLRHKKGKGYEWLNTEFSKQAQSRHSGPSDPLMNEHLPSFIRT